MSAGKMSAGKKQKDYDPSALVTVGSLCLHLAF